MFERFTDRARKVMALANQIALRFGSGIIRTEHILLGMLHEGSGLGATALREMGINRDDMVARLEARLSSAQAQDPAMSSWKLWWPRPKSQGKLPQEEQAKHVIRDAIEQAAAWRHNYVGTEHMLMGLLNDPSTMASQTLHEAGVTPERAERVILKLLGQEAPVDSPEDAPQGDQRSESD